MWREELHAFLVPVDGTGGLATHESALAHRGFVELPPFPKAAQGSRALHSTPLLIGRHTPCLYWALGNRLSCPRSLFELTAWSQTHAMPYPVPPLAPLHNVGVRLRCVDGRRGTRLCARRSPPMDGVLSSTSSAPVQTKACASRALEEGEHVWLEPRDRLIVCETLVLELVVLLAVRASCTGPTPDALSSPVMHVVSPEQGVGIVRIALPPVPWTQLSRQTRRQLVAKAVAQAERGSRLSKSASSRAEEDLVHTNRPSSPSERSAQHSAGAAPATDVDVSTGVSSQSSGTAPVDHHDRGAATPSRQNSQSVVVAPPTTTTTTDTGSARSPRARTAVDVSPRTKRRRTEDAHSSTPVPRSTSHLETLDALQLRSRSSQVAASGATPDPLAVEAPESYQSGGSGLGERDANSGSTVLAKNSYMETFDEHLNEALLQLENKSAEMNANWLTHTAALLGGAGGGTGGELLGVDSPLEAEGPKVSKSVSPSRTSPKAGGPRNRSTSKTPHGQRRRGRRSGDRARALSGDSRKPLSSNARELPFHGATESQEVFFQH